MIMEPMPPRFNARNIHLHSLDPFPWYAEMRASDPVHYAAEPGAWYLFRCQIPPS
jgi:hypothetical protein